MKFGIITHAIHKINKGNIYAYEPYVREMNLWIKNVDEVIIIAPISKNDVTAIEVNYIHPKIKVIAITDFNITSFRNLIKTLLVIPKICWLIFQVMYKVDHIHLRCPGNVGLLGSLIQVLFPFKQKTAKYAGNWDPKSEQPFTYRLQKKILSSTFLTNKIKVLVYGEWENQTKNIYPFFTASYFNSEINKIPIKKINKQIRLIFVGGLTIGKQPLKSVKTAHELIKKGYDVRLDLYGDGVKRKELDFYIKNNNLNKRIFLHGNKNKEIIKNAYKNAHFLIFISKSEGWPKVVAEAMFWGCLPISSNVSCVSYMLGNSKRGSLLNSNVNVNDIVTEITTYCKYEKIYQQKVLKAINWSQTYTLDKFDFEIKRIINNR